MASVAYLGMILFPHVMVSLLLSPEPDLGKGHVVKTIYDPACGTGGMLSVAEDYLLEHNSEANPPPLRSGPE